MKDVNKILDTYKNHTATYTCRKFNLSKFELNKILIQNGVTKHTPSETTHLSALENPNQGTAGTKYYNNGVEQGRFKPGEQPAGWKEGGLKFTVDQTELMLAKRGNRSPMQTAQGKANYYKSLEAKYGDEYSNIAQVSEIKAKTKKTNLDKYGVEYVMQNDKIRSRAEATCLDRYGSTYYVGSKECRDKFGKENLLKMLDTKKKNHTFNTSNMEEEYYNYLISIYGKDDVIRNYNKDGRYPFMCDFYIPSQDLFIECNYHWTHGGKPFDENDDDCLNKLISWENKANEGSEYFKNAINTWTVRDVNKRTTAKKNKLNYIEIFN